MTKQEQIFSSNLLFLGLGYLVVEEVDDGWYQYDTDTILADPSGSRWPCWNWTITNPGGLDRRDRSRTSFVSRLTFLKCRDYPSRRDRLFFFSVETPRDNHYISTGRNIQPLVKMAVKRSRWLLDVSDGDQCLPDESWGIQCCQPSKSCKNWWKMSWQHYFRLKIADE